MWMPSARDSPGRELRTTSGPAARSSNGSRSDRSRSPTRSDRKSRADLEGALLPGLADGFHHWREARDQELERSEPRPLREQPAGQRLAVERADGGEQIGGQGAARRPRRPPHGVGRSRLEQRAQVGIRRRHHLAGAVSRGERLRDPSEARHAAHRIEPMPRWLALRHGVAVPPLPRAQRLDRNRRRARERADREHPAGGPHVVRSVCALSGSGLDQWTNHLGSGARTYKPRSGVVSRFRFSQHRFVFLSEPYGPPSIVSIYCTDLELDPIGSP